MAKVRVRKDGKLYFDFQYKSKRCREYTQLIDTVSNRKLMQKVLDKIIASIQLGQFIYSEFFPDSKKVKIFEKNIAPVITTTALQDAIYVSTVDIPNFSDFANLWYEEMKISWRISYQETILQILEKRLVPYFLDKKVSDITKADILQFRVSLGKVTTRNGKGLSASHINRHIKIVYMILSEAADRFKFILPTRIKPLKIRKSDIYPFSLEEIEIILNKVRSDFKNYFTMRFFTGMRTGEADGLKWKYINFRDKEIYIRETIVDGRVEYTKTDASQRTIKMNKLVFEALKEQQKLSGNGEFVFVNTAGNPLDHRNVTKRVWYPLLRFLNLDKRKPYQMRHTCASLWLGAGESAEWIAKQLGHENTTMLFTVYSRYVPNLTRTDGSAFENLLNVKININPTVITGSKE